MLRIMKDSRIGTWGALGIALLILSKFELLQNLPEKAGFFLLAMTASRWAQVGLSFCLPYAGSGGGLGESVALKIGSRELVGATIFLFLPVLWLRAKGLVVLGCLFAFLVLLGIFFKRKAGGLTGDMLGAASELTELFVFLSASVLFSH